MIKITKSGVGYMVVICMIQTLSTARAGELVTTNVFEAGMPARADEVNQNFADVEAAVNDNDARISTNTTSISSNATEISNNSSEIDVLRNNPVSISVYHGEQRIGALVEIEVGNENLTLISDTGYLESLTLTGDISISYASNDCTGQAYTYTRLLTNNGLVIRKNSTEKVYFEPDATSVSVTINSNSSYSSLFGTSTCQSVPGHTGDYIPMQVNVPEITGIPNSYTQPLRIGY